jgi:opacity protein-like surface antigen
LRTVHGRVTVLLALLFNGPALAADPTWNWSGFYLGGHAGGFTGTTNFSNPLGPSIFGDDVTTPGFLAGLQLGYNQQLAPQWVAGAELNGSILSSQGQNTCLQPSITLVGANCRSLPREIATLTGRLGYLLEPNGRTMIFGRGGVAWMRTQIDVNPNSSGSSGFTLTGDPNETGEPLTQSLGVWGWTVGAGVEYAIAPKWSLNLSYDYLRFNGFSVGTPQTVEIASSGNVTTVPGGNVSNGTQSLHIARIGLNYHWGGMARASEPADSPQVAWVPGWEFEGGARYWYSWGNFQSSNGGPNSLVSRLPYNNMEGHSGELFARLDSPFGVFVKALAGGGGISHGTMYDEDWGLDNQLAAEPTGYEITVSGINGSFNYFTGDIGYNVLRGPDHKVGLFVGYNRYQTVMNTLGCAQMVAPGSGVCFPNIPSNVNAISEIDTWHSLRVGASAELQLADRLKVSADIAYLPYVRVDGLDNHRLRDLYFPATGTGNGVQGEIMLSYRVFDAASIGIGGRYWSMWTTNAYQTDQPSNVMSLSTDRYGVIVQASYKFN